MAKKSDEEKYTDPERQGVRFDGAPSSRAAPDAVPIIRRGALSG